MRLVVTVDTEEDDWNPGGSANATTENIKRLPALQQLFDEFDVTPTYFVTYPVATNEVSIAILKELAAAGNCEIGAHCHPWNTPPFEEELNNRNSMLCNLPGDLQYRKMQVLHHTIQTQLGCDPISFRSGRWAYGQAVAKNLVKLGYKIDSSITPYTAWTDFDGPDFSAISARPFRFCPEHIFQESSNGTLLEIPVTIEYVGYLNRRPALCRAILKALKQKSMSRLRLAGILATLNLLNKVWLSPEVSVAKTMIRLTQCMQGKNVCLLTMAFHSSSLLYGLNPFVQTKEEERQFIERIRTYLGFARDSGVEPLKLSDTLHMRW